MTSAAMVDFQIKATPTFRDMMGRFAAANAELLNVRRDLMREEGRRFTMLAQDEAPGQSYKFKRSIGFRTFVESDAVGFRVHMAQPLGTFIQEGTRPHPITAHGKSLRFFWPSGPQGPGIYFFYSVRHPGTNPNPFMARAYRKWRPHGQQALRRISTWYVETIRGQSAKRRP